MICLDAHWVCFCPKGKKTSTLQYIYVNEAVLSLTVFGEKCDGGSKRIN